MSNKILVALDGSDGSKRALSAAAAHAKLTNSDLVLAYVIDWSPYSFHTPQELEERHQRRESEMSRPWFITEELPKPCLNWGRSMVPIRSISAGVVNRACTL
jgi:nucleotide-binding universal stress UspA family protein